MKSERKSRWQQNPPEPPLPKHLQDLKNLNKDKPKDIDNATVLKVLTKLIGVLFGNPVMGALPFVKRFVEKNVELKPKGAAIAASPGAPKLPTLPGNAVPTIGFGQKSSDPTRFAESKIRSGPNRFVWVLMAGVLVFGGYLAIKNDRGDRSTATTATTTETIATTATTATTITSVTVAAGNDLQRLWRSIVLIEVEDGNESWSGSGSLVVNGSYILTNFHVAPGEGPEYEVWFTSLFEEEPQEGYYAEFVVGDEINDLALLRIINADGSPVVVSGRTILKPSFVEPKLLPGEKITILGYPGVGGLTMTLVQGVYSGKTQNEYGEFFKTDGIVSGGVSGGAAFNSSGELIGIPTASKMDDDFNSAIGLLKPARYAAELISRVKP